MQRLKERTNKLGNGYPRARLTERNEGREEDYGGQVDQTIFDYLQESQKSCLLNTSALTIRRRCFLCFREYNGARICFDGRNQTNVLVSSSNGQTGNYLT